MDAFFHLAGLVLVHVGPTALEVAHLIHEGFPGQVHCVSPQGSHPPVGSCSRVGWVYHG